MKDIKLRAGCSLLLLLASSCRAPSAAPSQPEEPSAAGLQPGQSAAASRSSASVEQERIWTRQQGESVAGTLEECGDPAEAASRHLELKDVSTCEMESFVHGDERIYLITLYHGPAQDCPSGCFQNKASAVVRSNTIVGVPTPRVRLSLYGQVRTFLRQALRERDLPLIHPGTEREYDFFMPEGWCANDHDNVRLMTRGNEVYWSIDLPSVACEPRISGAGGARGAYDLTLDGQITIPITGVPDRAPPQPDLSAARLTVRKHEPPR